MEQVRSRQVVLAARPAGEPRESDFSLEETLVPEPAPGEVLVRNVWMSVDPYMRGRMIERRSYVPPFQIGRPLEGGAVGRVVRSNAADLLPGEWVASMLGWREHFVASPGALRKLDTRLAPPSAFLGVLGLPGFTGWFGLKEIGRPQAGETLAVSGAAGATGSLVVQMGKILGCRVVGTAGTDLKCAWVRALGADEAINYRKAGDLYEGLRAACPQGIDVYFENVGGPLLDAVLRLVNPFARIPLCGAISQYNLETPEPGPRYLFNMVRMRVRMQGFIISDHWDRYPEFLGEVGAWVQAGRIRYRETVVEGIERAPRAFIGLLRGENTGKMLVRLGSESE